MSGTRIRLACVADADAVARGEHDTAAEPGFLVARPGEIPVSAFARKIEELTTLGRYIVCEVDGRIAGHAFLDPMRLAGIAHVFRLNLVVYPGYRRRGLGGAMLASLLEWAHADGRVGKVELNVRASNAEAIRLYLRHGFEQEGRLRRRVKLPDGSLVDDLVMGLGIGVVP